MKRLVHLELNHCHECPYREHGWGGDSYSDFDKYVCNNESTDEWIIAGDTDKCWKEPYWFPKFCPLKELEMKKTTSITNTYEETVDSATVTVENEDGSVDILMRVSSYPSEIKSQYLKNLTVNEAIDLMIALQNCITELQNDNNK